MMLNMRFSLALGFALLACSGSGVAESNRYVLDPQHLTIGFLVEHIGFAKVLGTFREAEGSFTFDEETGKVSDVRVVVKTESVFTSVPDRDRHLRSEDFLDVETHPEMVFESSGTTLVDGKGELSGTLTLLGVQKPLSLDVTWNKSAVSPLPGNPYVAGFSARGSFQRSEFGMTYGVADALVGDAVELIIELEGHRQ
jgi:polyisoprenoid-binding protein YceI